MAFYSKDKMDAIEAEMNQFEMEMRANMAKTTTPEPKSYSDEGNMYVSAPKKLRVMEAPAGAPPPPPPPRSMELSNSNQFSSVRHPSMIGPQRPQQIPPPPPPPSGMRPTFRPPQLNRPRPPPMPRPPRPPPGIMPGMPPQGLSSSVPVIPPPRPPPHIMGSQRPPNYMGAPRPPLGYRPPGMPQRPPNPGQYAPPHHGDSHSTQESNSYDDSGLYSSSTLEKPPVISSSQVLYSSANTKKKSKKNKDAASVDSPSLDEECMDEKELSSSIMESDAPPGTESAKTTEQNDTLFEKIVPPTLEKTKNDNSNKSNQNSKKEKKEKKKKFVRTAAGDIWEDHSLLEWDNDDFRIFAGDLGNEVTDEVLIRAFSRYPSFQKAKVVRDKRSAKTRGYGFISFKDPNDFVKAMREMNGKYVGNRPIKLRKSSWKDRNIEIVRKKEKEKKRLGLR